MTKVLFIAGMPHSGTTILSQVLGEVEGLTGIGESFYLWAAHERGWPCGCGRLLAECPWWSAVLTDIEGLRPDRYYMSLLQLRREPPAAYRRALARTVHAVAERAGADVIVEASKSPTYGRILGSLPGVDLHVVHLVRTPEAVANSWSRFEGEAGRPARHAAVWMSWNTTIELLWGRRQGRYLRVRYEDFARAPRQTAAAVVRFAGGDPETLPFLSDDTVRLGVGHTVAGNPVRFRSGDVEIRLDDAWRSAYPPRDRRILEALTWPLRARYGYHGT
ncbi:MAG TPA: sulfotransferase [Gaiellaceae bacterium]|nr:sulfotransferase [Gaiellaceae bacterium]